MGNTTNYIYDNVITAEEAKNLSRPSYHEHVAKAFDMIRVAAKNGKTSIHLTGDFWEKGGYNGTREWKMACDILKSYGFNVRFFYEERQFVDMYMIVSWD